MVIFLWKITQGLVSGYSIPFTPIDSRTGRKAVPAIVPDSAPAAVRKVQTGLLAMRGAQLFNLLPASLRNSEHGDILMFKNHLDIFLTNIPDEPTVQGLARGAQSNSLLHQIPHFESSF